MRHGRRVVAAVCFEADEAEGRGAARERRKSLEAILSATLLGGLLGEREGELWEAVLLARLASRLVNT